MSLHGGTFQCRFLYKHKVDKVKTNQNNNWKVPKSIRLIQNDLSFWIISNYLNNLRLPHRYAVKETPLHVALKKFVTRPSFKNLRSSNKIIAVYPR